MFFQDRIISDSKILKKKKRKQIVELLVKVKRLDFIERNIFAIQLKHEIK